LDGLTRSFRLVPAVLALAAALAATGAAPLAFVPQSPRSAAKHTTTFHARVASIVDGDTLRVIDASGTAVIVRVEGIDCPESGQPFGGVARRFMRAAAFDREVDVRVVGRDAHKRLIARVSVAGQDLSTQLLRAGLAWHYTEYSHDGRAGLGREGCQASEARPVVRAERRPALGVAPRCRCEEGIERARRRVRSLFRQHLEPRLPRVELPQCAL